MRGGRAFSGRVHAGAIILLWFYVATQNEHLDHVLNPILLVIGALFPDADHKKAPLGKIIPLWKICTHRGFTHSIQGLATFTGLVWLWNVSFSLSFAIGYLSHLLLDSLTPSGVRWIWRKRKNPFLFMGKG